MPLKKLKPRENGKSHNLYFSGDNHKKFEAMKKDNPTWNFSDILNYLLDIAFIEEEKKEA